MRKILLSLLAVVMPLVAFSQELKIGYLNTEEVMMAMPEISNVEKELAAYSEKNTKYLTDMETEIKNEEAKYQKMEATATATMKADQEAKIQTLYQRYQTTARTVQQDIQQKQMSLIQPVQEKLLKAIQAVGEKNGFLTIMESGVFHYKSSQMIDVTELVKKELNIKATPAKTTSTTNKSNSTTKK